MVCILARFLTFFIIIAFVLDSPAYAKYVAHRAAELRRENKDGDPRDPARETLRKAMDTLDNVCNGLSGQILQRVLETEIKSSSMGPHSLQIT